MQIRNVTLTQLENALRLTNALFSNNIKFRRCDQKKNAFIVTLTVKDSRAPGGRRSLKGRRIAAACWHVHGAFFDALLEENDEAVIKTSRLTISAEGGNWQDFDIGSPMFPMYYSEACDC